MKYDVDLKERRRFGGILRNFFFRQPQPKHPKRTYTRQEQKKRKLKNIRQKMKRKRKAIKESRRRNRR